MKIHAIEKGDKVKTEHTGLSNKEARKKLETHGLNTLREKKKISPLKILFDQFNDFMVLILLVSTVISAFMGEMTEAVTILAIVALNAIMGFVQEYRTERTMEALKGLAAPMARVMREGAAVSIPAEEIVPGDLMLLEAGDRVPADGMLVEAKNLQVDESLLTGESIPAEKAAAGKEGKKPCTENTGYHVYMGTIVTGGRGKAIVHSTGMGTEMGKIADMIQDIDDEQTPLQKRLDHLGKFIVYGCLAICTVVSVTGILRGEALFTMLLAGISLAVAAVPEGLPAVVTIALALGVQRMLKRNALIRKLPAVETLGCASVICSDKTGTLTENKMTVRRIYSAENFYDVEGSGINPEGDFISKGKTIMPFKIEPLKLTLEICGLCNNSKLVREKDTAAGTIKKIKTAFSRKANWRLEGDPTEGALRVAAEKGGLTEEYFDKNFYRVDEIPFDSERKCMSVVCKNLMGETYVFTKGAPDMIIKKCTKVYTSRGVTALNPILKAAIMNSNDSMASEALRVLGVAYRKMEQQKGGAKEVESDLTFVGLVGMIDPPRREALDAVQKCRMAGIKPVMITGDHKITAAAIAKELHILGDGDRVLTGSDLEEMKDVQLEKAAPNVSVYARVTPGHKLRIVRALRRLGHIVAMTGDGVNDAPAIKEADIGVAMGITGTDVTREASAMVLLDDNFATIVAAVEEGRVIYNNIRKFIRYMLACNLGEVLTMFLGMLMGLPLPLMPIQILWVNLVTDGLPAIALGLDPAERDVMLHKPRGSKDAVFSNGLLPLILFRGILIGLSTLAVFITILHFTGNVEQARTAAFITLVLTQLIHVFECKSERKTILEIPVFNNKALVLAVLISLIMLLAVVYIPVLQEVFKTVSLSYNEWIVIAGFSLLGPAAASVFSVNRKYTG